MARRRVQYACSKYSKLGPGSNLIRCFFCGIMSRDHAITTQITGRHFVAHSCVNLHAALTPIRSDYSLSAPVVPAFRRLSRYGAIDSSLNPPISTVRWQPIEIMLLVHLL